VRSAAERRILGPDVDIEVSAIDETNRRVPLKSIVARLASNWAQGVDRFFITDDNFARNKDWEAIYDRIIELREKDGLRRPQGSSTAS
jgi:hypothetical protein